MTEPRPVEVRAAGAVLWRPAPAAARDPVPAGAAAPGVDPVPVVDPVPAPGVALAAASARAAQEAADLPAPVEVALVHRPRYDDWSLPKGKAQPGEHLLRAAVREVAEETGVRAVLGRRLRPVHYLSDGKHKRVDYWAAQAVAEQPFEPNAEVDQLSWLPLAQAAGRLSYPHDAQVLAEFAASPPATTPLILLRHASAVSKSRWWEDGHRDDLARPLTDKGRAQARALAGLLSCFGPALAVSSSAERCLATVRPYAAAAGVALAAEPALTPGRPAGSLRAVMDRLPAGQPAVVCAHRENLPDLVRLACERLGTAAPEGPPLRKAAFWVLHAAGGRLVSAEHHHVSA